MPPRSVIVTGASGALGRVVAAAFSAQGDKVARISLTGDASSTNQSGIDVTGVDLTVPDASDIVIDRVTAAFGGVDVVVNIAGGFVWQAVDDGDVSTWERMYAINVITALSMTKSALPWLTKSKQGSVINIGAEAALRADVGKGAYGAAKSGIHRLTESLASELSMTSVRVNAVLPSIIDTPVNRADMPDADFDTWVTPDSIAEVILFLASPASRAISGALIPVTRATAQQK